MERITTFGVWFILVIFLGISISGGFSEGQQHLMKKTRSSAVVVGTVYCDTCFNGAFSKSPNHLIPGALVAVECIDENSKPSFRQEVKTDEHGEFKAKLPFPVSKHVKRIKRCSVKLLTSSQPYCSIAASATSSSLKRLQSSKHGENTRVFSAGFFTFKPENQPDICSQKPINLRVSKPLLPDPAFPPPIQDPVPNNPSPLPNLPILPPLPDLPLPQLPPLLPPGPHKSDSLHNKKDDSLEGKKTEVLKPDFFFPPNPVTPILPPNPLFPPLIPPNPLNPPSLIPPNPLFPPLIPPNPLNPPSFIPPNPLFPPLIPPNPLNPPSLIPPNPLNPPSLIPPNPINPPSLIPPNPLNPPSLIPPNPLNPPSLIPPNPLIPSPPTLPPLPFQPPPSTLLPPLPSVPTLPPVPVITPPSPPPPSFPIPLPPIIPGIPPASTSFSSHRQP